MKSALIRYLPLVILAAAWEIAARSGLVSSLALPPLSKVAAAFVDLARDGELLGNGLSSLYRGGAGLLLAVVIGSALGSTTSASTRSRPAPMLRADHTSTASAPRAPL